jgi:triacylglycerol lipase
MPVPGYAGGDPSEEDVAPPLPAGGPPPRPALLEAPPLPAGGPPPRPAQLEAPPGPAGAWWGQPLAETRWSLELARLLVDPVFRGEGVPHGSGRPVILMPGFLAGDQTLAVIAAWLRRIGYRPHVCGFVANIDCSDRAADRVQRRVVAIHRRYGRRVALIGHSRGGHYARAIAARAPQCVSHAISLGADLRGLLGISVPTEIAVSAVQRGLRATGRARSDSCVTLSCPCAFTRDYSRTFPSDLVRLTSIYSKEDGVVHWQNQNVPEADCVEVTGSHVGLIFNRKAYRAIAHALARPELIGNSY